MNDLTAIFSKSQQNNSGKKPLEDELQPIASRGVITLSITYSTGLISNLSTRESLSSVMKNLPTQTFGKAELPLEGGAVNES